MDSMASQVLVQILILVCFVTGTSGWRCAKYENYFSQQPDYIDCLWDCCGNSFNRHCCAPIGIIVGCCIVGAFVVALLTVLLICWWQRRRAKEVQGPRLFHNQRHSHYPVAPSSVTRPAPVMAFTGPETDADFKKPLDDDQEFGAPRAGYRPGPPQGYRPGPPQGYRPGPPQGYRPGPPQGYRPPPQRSDKPAFDESADPPPLDEYHDKPPQGYRPGPPPTGHRQNYPSSEKLNLGPHSGERAVDI